MKREATVVLAVGALALSGCQTTGTGPEYVKVGKGPTLEVATEQCDAYAAKAGHLVIGVGSVEAAALGFIATVAATTSAKVHAFRNCMAAQGYVKNGARTAPQAGPAPAPKAAPAPAAAKAPTKPPAKASPGPTRRQAG